MSNFDIFGKISKGNARKFKMLVVNKRRIILRDLPDFA